MRNFEKPTRRPSRYCSAVTRSIFPWWTATATPSASSIPSLTSSASDWSRREGLGIEVEFTSPATAAQELEHRGFAIIPAERPIGGAQAIRIDWKNGTLIGGSKSRKDGIALGL